MSTVLRSVLSVGLSTFFGVGRFFGAVYPPFPRSSVCSSVIDKSFSDFGELISVLPVVHKSEKRCHLTIYLCGDLASLI